MSEYADNYMTDEKNVHWVKMDYVGPIMKKDELAMDKLTAENARLTAKLKESDQREIELIKLTEQAMLRDKKEIERLKMKLNQLKQRG